jgi:hypothetical protein
LLQAALHTILCKIDGKSAALNLGMFVSSAVMMLEYLKDSERVATTI